MHYTAVEGSEAEIYLKTGTIRNIAADNLLQGEAHSNYILKMFQLGDLNFLSGKRY
jgi:hypothetical protein